MKTQLSAFAVYKSSAKKTSKHSSKSANATPKKKHRKRLRESRDKLESDEVILPSLASSPASDRMRTSVSNGLESSPFLTPVAADSPKKTKKRVKKKMKMETSTPSNGAAESENAAKATAVASSSGSQQHDGKVEVPVISASIEEVEIPASTSSNSYMFDSRVEGERCLEWLIHPFNKEKFFLEVWEKKPLLLKRQNSNYYRELFSTSQLDSILREKCLWFGKNVDVTTYTNGRRETHNPAGRAHASTVWDFYQNGCSVRLLNPQTFARSIWKLNVTLQEAFGSFVGANVYLTPAGTQGFAPHYDDIEAFVLQLEGRKTWKLYNPRTEEDVLPRTSSGNFREEDLDKPVLDVELKAGDLLYFPRGTIHQASTPLDTHSLHLTVSSCQRNTWGDLFEKFVPRLLQLAIEKDVEFRKALPRDYSSYMGIANSDLTTPKRTEFEAMTRRLLDRMADSEPLDAAVDQMAKGYIHDSLPPLLTKGEKARTIFGSGERWTPDGVVGNIELDPDTRIKLLRANLIRLVMEDDGVNLYHSVDNSREYHADEIQCVPMTPQSAPAVEHLIHAYPNFVDIESLPLDTLESKMEVANILYDSGLLITEDPIQPLE